MPIWTLEYNGVEKELKDWGICDDYQRGAENKGKGSVKFRTVEDFDDGGPQFAAEASARIWKDRTAIGTGGTLWFQGFFDDPKRVMDEGRQWIFYALHNVWWQFERHQFKQRRKEFGGYVDHDASKPVILNTIVLPEVYLGEGYTEVAGTTVVQPQTNGQQVREIINWVNECFNPTKQGATSGRDDAQDIVRAGTIEPAVYIPINRRNSTYCAQAVIDSLRWSPDAIIIVDSTQPIPVLHVRTFSRWDYTGITPAFLDYNNLTEVTVNITTEQERAIQLQSNETKKLPGALIHYRKSIEVDNFWAPQIVIDKFPAGVTDYTPFLASYLVELAGAKTTSQSANVKCQAISTLTAGTAAAKAAWWRAHDATLGSARVDPATIVFSDLGGAVYEQIKDADGNAIDLTAFPNELLNNLPEWTGKLTIEARVRAVVSYSKYDNDARTGSPTTVTERETFHTITLTNAVQKLYQVEETFDTGDAVPSGVAEAIYRSTNLTQYAGSITLTGDQARADIVLGCRLKLVGPNTTFTNVFPQAITETPHDGRMTVEYGPAAPVDLDVWLEIARYVQARQLYNMPSGRAAGAGSGNSLVKTGGDGSRNNTAHGPGGDSSSQQPVWL